MPGRDGLRRIQSAPSSVLRAELLTFSMVSLQPISTPTASAWQHVTWVLQSQARDDSIVLAVTDRARPQQNTVNRANKYVTVLVVAHLFINIVHGAAHQKLHVTLPPTGMVFVVVVILLGPLLALALLWTSQKRLGLLLLTVSMAASAVFGLYHHLLVRGADHVSAQPPGPAGTAFVVTAYLLFLTEALGTILGLYFLRKKPSSAPV